MLKPLAGASGWTHPYDDGWGGQPLPGGLTDAGPAIVAYDNKLMAMVKDLGQGIWINIYDGSWTG